MSICNKYKRFLVTGGAGFMGSAFIRLLIEKGCTVVNLDLLTYAANLDNLKSVAESPLYHFVRGDIKDRTVTADLLHDFEIDCLVHYAAETHVDRSLCDPRLFFETNALGTLELLEAVRTRPSTHFHLISTDEVYGALGKEGCFTEESPYMPNSPYSASKAAADHLVRSYVKSFDLCATVSHSCNNYGPGQYPEKLIPLMIHRAMAGQTLPVYGKGNQVREWLYVEDHARAIWTILERGVSGGVYNIGGEREVANIDLVHKLLTILGKDKENPLEELITFVEDRPGHDFRYALDSKKVKELGFSPQITLEEGLKRTIEWYLNPDLIYNS